MQPIAIATKSAFSIKVPAFYESLSSASFKGPDSPAV